MARTGRWWPCPACPPDSSSLVATSSGRRLESGMTRISAGGEQQAIARLPVGPAELPLQHAQLMSEWEYLGAKPGVEPNAGETEACEEASN